MAPELTEQELAGETPPELPLEEKPKRKKGGMVNVYNSHKFRSFHLRHGDKIKPGEQRKIPNALYEKVRETCPWLKRAERGDVL